MTTHQFSDVITTEEALRTVVGHPTPRAVEKSLLALDAHCRKFISRSPFVLVSTSDASGKADVSPKGDKPGFVVVVDDHTLLVPDRPGNRRVDSLSNIIQNPNVGLLFLVPGIGEMMRVNGKARLVRDGAYLAQMAVNGKQPLLAIAVDVQEAFIHCAKAVIRSSIWKSETWTAPEDMPSLARVIGDQVRSLGCTVEEYEQQVKVAYTQGLY